MTHLFSKFLGLALAGVVAYELFERRTLYSYRYRDSLDVGPQWVERSDHPVIYWIAVCLKTIGAIGLLLR